MVQDRNLRGDKTTRRATALVIADILSDYRFVDADRFLPQLPKLGRVIHRLRAKADDAGAPVVYVNDNVGAWRSDRHTVVAQATAPASKLPAELATLLPRADDYFLLKPQYSAFFGTPLESLLFHLGVERIVLCGIATEICVLFSAHDAYLRGFGLHVPRDAVAGTSVDEHETALALMKRALKTDIRSSRAVAFD
jgi:nicotinamidase-related amidase